MNLLQNMAVTTTTKEHNDKITDGKLSRMMKNARKLTDVFREQGDPFMPPEYEDDINFKTFSQMKL